jgi:hypothetical protein
MYSSTNIIRVIKSRRMRWAVHVALWKRGGVYRVLVEKPEGKKQLGRTGRRWEADIKMGIKEVGCGGMDFIDLAQDRNSWRALVNAIMNFRAPLNTGNFLTK